jgi:hypothetical protein
MEIIITESQYKLILEQPMGLAPVGGYDYQKPQAIKKAFELTGLDPHTILAIAGIGSAFIPVVGPFISAGIGLADASLYYKEGDKTSATISAVFSLLPFIGKIPGVKETGSAVWKTIASKFTSGAKLTQLETELVQQVITNSSSIQTLVSTASKKLSPLVKQITELKPSYIKRYGQEAYEKLMRDFISGVSDQNYFLQSLKAGGQAAPKSLSAVAKFGLKFSQSELSNVKNLASNVLYGGDVLNSIDVVTPKGLKKISVIVADNNFMKKFYPRNIGTEAFTKGDDTIILVKDSLKKFDKTNIEELLYHEIAHIKDPAQISSKLKSSYLSPGQEATFKNYFGHAFEKTANLTSTIGNMTNTFNYWKKLMPIEQLTGYLDEIINYGKGKVKKLSSGASSMIGKDGVQQLTDLSKGGDIKAFNNFISKIVQQADYLKSQAKIAM